MKNYELLYILPSGMTGKEIKENFQEIEKNVAEFGGQKLVTLLNHPFLLKTEISKEEESEELKNIPVIKRKLAYPIKKNRFGFYCLFNFSCQEENIKEIDKYLRMNKNVLRHIIIQEEPMSEEELKELNKLFARKRAEQEKEKKEEDEKEKAEILRKEKAKSKEKSEIFEKPQEKKEEEKHETPISAAEKPETKKKKGEKDETDTEAEAEKNEKKKKIKLEDLEDKLDEILEDTML